MPQTSSFADLIRDWEKLLSACQENSAALASVEPQRLTLGILLARGRELKDRQDALTAQKQQATQELEALKEEAKEAARRLRGAVKSILGTRSELLVRFNMAPLRKRGPRKAFVKPPGTPNTATTTGSPPPEDKEVDAPQHTP